MIYILSDELFFASKKLGVPYNILLGLLKGRFTFSPDHTKAISKPSNYSYFPFHSNNFSDFKTRPVELGGVQQCPKCPPAVRPGLLHGVHNGRGRSVTLEAIFANSTSPEMAPVKRGEGGEKGQPNFPQSLTASGSLPFTTFTCFPSPVRRSASPKFRNSFNQLLTVLRCGTNFPIKQVAV